MINVFINGYGGSREEGSRCSSPPERYEDNWRFKENARFCHAEQAIKKGFDLYCVEGADVDAFKKRGLETNGYLKDIKDSVE